MNNDVNNDDVFELTSSENDDLSMLESLPTEKDVLNLHSNEHAFLSQFMTFKVTPEEVILIKESLDQQKHPGGVLRNNGMAYLLKNEPQIMMGLCYNSLEKLAKYADLVVQAIASDEHYQNCITCPLSIKQLTNPTVIGNVAFVALYGLENVKPEFLRLINDWRESGQTSMYNFVSDPEKKDSLNQTFQRIINDVLQEVDLKAEKADGAATQKVNGLDLHESDFAQDVNFGNLLQQAMAFMPNLTNDTQAKSEMDEMVLQPNFQDFFNKMVGHQDFDEIVKSMTQLY